MHTQNPYKKSKELPPWVFSILKVILVGVFAWQFSKQLPSNYWEDSTTVVKKMPIKTVEYSQLLGTTTLLNAHYLQWGDQKIHYLEPSQTFSAPFYDLSKTKIKELSTAKWELIYKGKTLDIANVHAVLIPEEGLMVVCEQAEKDCLTTLLEKQEQDFDLWICLETQQQKRFFTKLHVGTTRIQNKPAKKEAQKVWEKLIKREKYKDIDDLTVAKPVFKSNKYLFKWGDWERHVDRSLTEPSIQVDTATFKNWLRHHSPYLYKEGKFIPFSFSVGFWDRKRWDRNCYLRRSTDTPSILDTYPCLDRLIKEATVGDVISLFIYQKEDFLERITNPEFDNGIPSYILNGRQVRLYMSITLTAEPSNPHQQPLELSTSQFAFQLHNGLTTGPVVKMDTTHLKNQDLFDHYQSSGSAKVVHIPNFTTIRRVFNPEDHFVAPEQIREVQNLMDTMYAVHTFPEFYDFDILPPTINSRGLSTVLDKSCYWLEDYINFRDPFEISLGTEKVKLLQTNLTIIPKEGPIIQYITDNPDRYDINTHLDRIDPETSIYFDNILFERDNGERLAFPLAVALHLK